MDIHEIRQKIKVSSIYDIPIRVTFYARVSSEKDEQLNSLDNQISYYTDLIKSNKNWTYVDGYIDEGISGISTQKRENFHRMISDAKLGAFDLIITKEISRFARNTLDSIKFTRELLNDGVGVFFQNDNINTLDEDSELRLTIMSGIAQDELRKLSSRIKFGHQQAIKNKVVIGNSRIFGYVKDNKRLVIEPEEAKMVRELFELYSTDEYSMKQIEDLFWAKGYRNLNGNKIAHSTMSNIISNPKYKGYYCGNKVKVIDMFTKKQKFLEPDEWVMFKDETGEIVPAIVSEELWDKANAVLSRRSHDVKGRQNKCNHMNLLTGKLFCTHCGKPYYRRESKDKSGNANSIWICSGKIKNGAASCPSFAIYESDIRPILLDVFNETAGEADKYIDEYIALYKTIANDSNTAKAIAELEKKIAFESKKKAKLLDYNINGDITDKDYIKMNKEAAKKIEAAEAEKTELENKLNSESEFKRHLDEIRTQLESAKRDAAEGLINTAFINKYIDKIYVTADGNTMSLNIKLFTGETCEKYLEKLRRRAAQTNSDSIIRTGQMALTI
ncbi:MAG: recombinase family protein [Clostridiales bacterium]|nr:recombinase family protein [Clostridiales bacterium]